MSITVPCWGSIRPSTERSVDGVVTENSVGGWIANKLHAIDFAGGTVVHINAGAAALAVAIVLGKSALWGQLRKPHNVPLTLLGAGLLWAGWYAFNGGSALAAGNSAAIVMVTTFVATCAATLAWLAVEKIKDGHVTGVGAASGAITGLVAITPLVGRSHRSERYSSARSQAPSACTRSG